MAEMEKKKQTKKQKHREKMTLVSQILLEVWDTAKEINEIINHPRAWLNDYHPIPKTYKDRQVLYVTINRLANEGYLEEVEERGERRYRATLKGQAKIWRYLKKNKDWDEKWRIVIFDIPEIKKEMRNYFRQRLIDLGFRKLQESVWICPYNIASKIEELIVLCDAEKYVHYLLVEEIDNRDVLMQLFKLNRQN